MTGWLIDINPRECPPDVMDAPEAYRAAFERQNRICPACGKAFADVEEGEADLVIAWSKGGRTVPDNCRWLCKACNRAKGDD